MTLRIRTTALAIFAALAGTFAIQSVAPLDAHGAESTGPRLDAGSCYHLNVLYTSDLNDANFYEERGGNLDDAREAAASYRQAAYAYNDAAQWFLSAWRGGCPWATDIES